MNLAGKKNLEKIFKKKSLKYFFSKDYFFFALKGLNCILLKNTRPEPADILSALRHIEARTRNDLFRFENRDVVEVNFY